MQILDYDVLSEPETVAYPHVAFPIAAWFWKKNAYPVTKNSTVENPTDLNKLTDGSFLSFTQLTHSLTNHISSLKERAIINEAILKRIGFSPLIRGQSDPSDVYCPNSNPNGDPGYAVPICLIDLKVSQDNTLHHDFD